MGKLPSVPSAKTFRNTSRIISAWTVVVGFAGLTTSAFRALLLTRGAPDTGLIPANTSMCMVLLGLSLWICNTVSLNRRLNAFAQVFGGAVALAGCLSLLQIIFGWNLGILDFAGMPTEQGASGVMRLGLMSTVTAVCFVLLGTALVLLDWTTFEKLWPAQILAILSEMFASFTLVDHVLASYGRHVWLALPTTIVLCIFPIGVLCSRPERGLIALQMKSSQLSKSRKRHEYPISSVFLRYGFAVVAVGTGVLLRMWLGKLGPAPPFLAFFPEVMVVCLLAGVGPGLLCVGLSGICSDYLFMPKVEELGRNSLASFIALDVFLLTGTAICLLMRTLDLYKERAKAEAQSADAERRVAEAKVKAERQRLESMLDALPIMIWLLSPDKQVRFANKTFRETLGEVDGRACYEYRFGGSSPCALCETFDVLKTNTPNEWEFEHEGRSIHVYDAPFTDVDGSPLVLKMDVDVTEERQAQRALSRSEMRLRTQLERMPIGCIVFDQDSRFRQINPAAEDIFGYTVSELIGKHCNVIVPESVRPHVASILERIAMGDLTAHSENENLTKDGRTIICHWTNTPLRDASGNFEGILSMVQDITERKQSEAALAVSELRFRTLFESAGDAIYLIRDGVFVACNKLAMQLFAGPGQPIIGQTPSEMSPAHQPDGRDSTQAAREKVSLAMSSDNPVRFEWTCFRGDGTPAPCEVTLSRLEIGEDPFLIGITRDMTDRLRAERALRASEERYRQFIEKDAAGFISSNLAGVVLDCNPAAARILGFDSPRSLIGMSAIDLYFSSENREDVIRRAQAKGILVNEELHLKRQDGSPIWVLANFSSFERNGEEEPRVQLSFSDVTDIRSFNLQIQELNRTLERKVEERTAELLKEKTFSEHLINSLPGIFYLNAESGELLRWNHNLETISGYTAQELANRKLLEFIAEEERDRVSSEMSKLLDDGIADVEADLILKDGKRTPYLFSGTRIDLGEKRGLLGFGFDLTERKRTERALRESEERFRLLTRNVASGVSLIDENGDSIVFNDAFRRIFAIPRDSHVPNIKMDEWSLWQFFDEHGQHFKLEDYPIRRAFLTSSAMRNKLVGVRTPCSFEIKWLLVSAEPIMDADGCLYRLICTYNDITALKQAEDALRESSAKLRATFTNVTEAIWVSDIDGNMIDFNDEFIRYHRLKTAVERGQNIRDITKYFDVWFPDGRPAPLEERSLARALRGESATNVEYCLRSTATGETWWGSYNFGPIRDQDGNITGAVVSGREVTPIKEAELALRESEGRFRTLAENVPALVWMCHPDGMYFYLNQRWVDYTGLGIEKSYGLGWTTPFHPDDQAAVLQAWTRATDSGEPYEIESRLRRSDGIYRWFLMRGIPLRDSEGKISRWLGTCTDIEDLRKTQDQLTAANKELDSFNYAVAHDLRAPLRHIRGFSELLLQESGATLNETAVHHLTIIRNSVNRMSQLIDDLLNLSRLWRQALHVEICNVRSLVDEVIEEQQPTILERSVEWRIGELPIVECDPRLFKQVLANLISKAVKFTRTIESAVIEVGQIDVDGEPVMFVRDNGVGFDMNYYDQLFGIFQRLHRQDEFEGTGVGLAIVRRIVSRHGGRVWATSAVNQGATFYVSLQAASSKNLQAA